MSTARQVPSCAAVLLGRCLVTTGVLAVLFAGHQLWATDLRTALHQQDLRTELDRATTASGSGVAEDAPAARADGSETGVQGAPAATELDRRPTSGAPLGRLRAPSIGLDVVVVEGAGRESLQHGPGRVTGSAALGGVGNAVIAGHRTTWGAPFGRLDRLRAGDRLLLRTGGQDVAYTVVGRRVTSPDDATVLAGAGGSRITLLTCHPRYSAARRLVVTAEATQSATGDGARRSAASSGAAAGSTTAAADVLRPVDPQPSGVDVGLPLGVALLSWWLGGLPWRAGPNRPGRAARWWARLAGSVVAVGPLAVAFDRLADLVPVGW